MKRRKHHLIRIVNLLVVVALLTSSLLTALPARAADYEGTQPNPSEIWVDIPADGESAKVSIRVRNTGTFNWTSASQVGFSYQYESGDSGTNWNTAGYYEDSKYSCNDWENDHRVENTSSTVASGSSHTFDLWFCNPTGESPHNDDSYPDSEHFALAYGENWMTDSSGNRIIVRVNLRVVHQARSLSPTTINIDLAPGETSLTQSVTVENDSTSSWSSSDDVSLSYQYESGDSGSSGNTESQFDCADWEAPYRPAIMNESVVSIGDDASFSFAFCAPDTISEGIYREHFAVAAGPLWMLDSNGDRLIVEVRFNVVVLAEYEASQPSPSTIQVSIPDGEASAKQTITVTNNGTETWQANDKFALNYQYESGDSGTDPDPTTSDYRASQFYCDDWVDASADTTAYPNARIAYLKNAPVDPGETAEFDVWFCNPNNVAPTINYPYTEHFALGRYDSGTSKSVWVTDSSGNRSRITVDLRAAPSGYNAAAPDPAEIWVDIPEDAQSKELTIEIENSGTSDWTADDKFALNYQFETGDDGTNPDPNTGGYRASRFYCGDWEQDGFENARIDYLTNAPVAPGEIGQFRVWYCNPEGLAPTTTDDYPYLEHLALGRVKSDGTGEWVVDASGNRSKVTVHLRVTHQAQDLHTSDPHPLIIRAYLPLGGTSKTVTATVTNDGPTVWDADPQIALNYQYQTGDVGSDPDPVTGEYRASKFFCNSWISNHRPVAMQESSVAEGDEATFSFEFCDPDPTTSQVNTTYFEHYALAGGPIWMLQDNGERLVLEAQIKIIEADSMMFEWMRQDFPEDEGAIPVPQYGEYTDVSVWFKSIGGVDPEPSKLQLCLRKDPGDGTTSVSSPPINDSIFHHSNWVTYTEALNSKKVSEEHVDWCIPGTPEVTDTPSGKVYKFQVDFHGDVFEYKDPETGNVVENTTELCQVAAGDYCREDFGVVYEKPDGSYEWIQGTDATGRPIEVGGLTDYDANVWWKLEIIEATIPLTPTIITPTNVLTNTSKPFFLWQDEEATADYFVLSIDGGDPITVSETWYQPTSDLTDGEHDWSITAHNETYPYPSLAATAVFTIDTLSPLNTFLLSTPADGTTICSSEPEFTWEKAKKDPEKDGFASEIAGYNLRFDGSTVVTVKDLDNLSYTPETALSNGQHTWDARTFDQAGNVSDWTATSTFTVDTTIAESPVLIAPIDSVLLCANPVMFSWKGGDACTVSYEFRVDAGTSQQIARDAAGEELDAGTDYTTSIAEGSHEWSVRAVNEYGNYSDWVTESVTVDLSPPSVPVLLLPEPYTTTMDTTPFFDWNDSTDVSPVTYTLQIQAASGGTEYTPINAPSGSNAPSSYTPDEPMSDGMYNWSVQAHDACQYTSDWAPTNVFTITKPPQTWTLLFYLSGDNNQATTVSTIINELELVADNAEVAVLALWDGDGANDTSLYHIQYDTDMSTIASDLISVSWNSGELNMGDPQTLRDFVNWGRSAYPSDYSMLSIFDHGGGWSPDLLPDMRDTDGWQLGGAGLAWDDSSNDYLSTRETGLALKDSTTDGANKIDVVMYDASLMAMFENAYEISEYASFFVASQNEILNTFAFDYIPSIATTTTPDDLAESMVDAYASTLPSTKGGTIAALDLSGASTVKQNLDKLTAEIRNENILLGDVRDEIADAYEDVQKFDYDEHCKNGIDPCIDPTTDGYIDLYHFAQLLSGSGLSSDTKSAAIVLQDSLLPNMGFVVKAENISGGVFTDVDNAHGVSIYAPFGEELYIGNGCATTDICDPSPGATCVKARDYYTNSTPTQPSFAFADDAKWDEFINDMIQAEYCSASPLLSGSEQLSTQSLLTGGFADHRQVNILSEFREGNLEPGFYTPTLSLSTPEIAWSEDASETVVITVSLSFVSRYTVTVEYTASGLSPESGTLVFPPGTRVVTKTFMVDDPSDSGSVSFELSDPVNVTLEGESKLVVPSISISDETVTEKDGESIVAVFEVSLSQTSEITVTVDYATSSGTDAVAATPYEDYKPVTDTLVFAPGTVTLPISVTVYSDSEEEEDETFEIVLSNARNARLAQDTVSATGTIKDDGSPEISISKATITEPSQGEASAVFSVTLSMSSSKSISVDYATSSGTDAVAATPYEDYKPVTDTLVFAPGTVTLPISVTVYSDSEEEEDETFEVVLSNARNARLAQDTVSATGTIKDDGSPTPGSSHNLYLPLVRKN